MSAVPAGPNMGAQALLYAGAGIKVFPVNRSKEPLTGKGGFHHATTDRTQVEQWWSRWPDAGIATPDFDVVDVDLYKPESKATWAQIRDLIPKGTPHRLENPGSAPLDIIEVQCGDYVGEDDIVRLADDYGRAQKR